MNENKHPEALIVTRNGYLDDEYYDAVYAAKRHAALHHAGQELVHAVLTTPAVIGKGIVYLLTTNAQHVNHG